jgi:hypothetical protein
MFRQNPSLFNNPQYNKYVPIYPSQINPQNNDQNKQNNNTLNPLKQIENIIPVKEISQPVIENKQNEKSIENKNFLDKNEFFEFMNTKFTKLDEALLSYKQEKYPANLSTIVNENNNNSNDLKLLNKKNDRTKQNNVNEENEIRLDNQINKTNKRINKSYGLIDDTLFDKVKEKWPNFPEDKKDIVVIDNDGNFFLTQNKKKIPLNNVSALKLINKK